SASAFFPYTTLFRSVRGPVISLTLGDEGGDSVRRHRHARGTDPFGGHLRLDLVDRDTTRHVDGQHLTARVRNDFHVGEDRRVGQLVDAAPRRIDIEVVPDERVRTGYTIGYADDNRASARVGEAGYGVGKIVQRVLDGSTVLR